MRTRRAFTLIEALMVVATGGLFMIGVAAMFHTFIYELPRNYRTVNESSTVLNLVDKLGHDVTSAAQLPGSTGSYTSDERTLLIAANSGDVVCYKVTEAGVERLQLRGDEETVTSQWSLPAARVDWKIRCDDGRPVALEVSTYVQHSIRNHTWKKFANSHIFFLNTPAKAVISQ